MKKGFTLIELLAVIVILAIIAVIAVPIVLNIISESKDSATLRSADFYLDAVELSVASSTLMEQNVPNGTYNIKDGDICINELCTETHEVEVNGEVPESGTITIENGNITQLNIFLNEKEIYKNSKNEMVYVKLLDEVCEPSEEQPYATNPHEAGYKYECKVNPNKDPYTFYVLTTPDTDDTRINLIMNANINSKEEAVIPRETGDKGKVDWVSRDDYIFTGGIVFPYEGHICVDSSNCTFNDKGPLTAMKFLSEATKNWTNTNEMTINTFTDETGTPVKEMETYNTYARMPIYLLDETKTELSEQKAYLFENLFDLEGYWSLSSYSGDPILAYHAIDDGHIDCAYSDYSVGIVFENSFHGVRPVITLKI